MRNDALIDRFVAHVNASALCAWSIRRSDTIDWLPSFEQRLPRRLPPSFRSLVARHVFPSFAVAGVQLLGNTGEAVDDELVRKPFRGFDLSAVLLARGYIRFARLETGARDPVCFDTGSKGHNNEYRMVVLDHEAELQSSRIRILDEVAPSFRRFVERVLEGTGPPPRWAPTTSAVTSGPGSSTAARSRWPSPAPPSPSRPGSASPSASPPGAPAGGSTTW